LKNKEIAKIFLINKISATLIIPLEIAKRHGLNEPSHVTVEECPEGILIKKLEV
jgi:bifunctional DNA-binding transcriptional regulator/antitoxin component of YhaV-PrlF toxin-antitoxin module